MDKDIHNVVLTNEKNSILGNEPIRNFCCVMCAEVATMASKPQNIIG